MSKVQKPKYNKFANKKNFRRLTLEPNSKGFLCSCNNREKDCVKEAYNILNKYVEKLVPPQSTDKSNDEVIKEETTIEDELKQELLALQSTKKEIKMFQVVESGAKNILFIKTTFEDPTKLAHIIVQDIETTKNQQTRFLIRLIPIEITCKAYLKDLENVLVPITEKYFKHNPKSFSVIFNHRNNNCLNRDEVIKLVADLVFKTNKDCKVDLKFAEISIVIEVIKGIVLIGVVPDFIRYKKYNLLAICDEEAACGSKMEPGTNEEAVTL